MAAILRTDSSARLDRLAGVTGQAARRAGRVVRLARPSAAWGLARSAWGAPVGTDSHHLDEVVAWLGRAQDATADGGVSAGYDLATGWRASYPETTGYIVPTLLHHADICDSSASRQRAVRMGEWLVEVQQSDGSIGRGLWADASGGEKQPEVFNTGQVLFGYVALAEAIGTDGMAAAAAGAARWLAGVQNADGSWSAHSLHGVPHAYYTRVAWALARAGRLLDEPAWTEAARRNVEWTCALQRDNGWIDRMWFTPGSDPLTHTVAYTIEGLLECGLVLDCEQAWNAGVAACDAAARSFDTADGCRLRNGDLAATVDEHWRASARYSCPTGSAQLAMCCQRVAAVDGRTDLARFADRLLATVKAAQGAPSLPVAQRGGIPGSRPLWGRYASLRYLNWAAKFTADALLDRVGGGLPTHRYG